MIKKIKVSSLCLAILLLAVMLVGCNSKATTSESKSGDKDVSNVLTVGLGRDLYYGSEDPTFLHDSLNVWESLTYVGDQMVPEPALATSWESSSDGLSWIFNLRQNVKFHDGTPFDADAVVFNINRMLNHPGVDVGRNYGDLKEVKAIDDYKVKFTFSTPTPAFPAMIGYPYGSPMFSPKCIDKNGNIIKPVGTGPFMFEKYKPGDCIILKANQSYWKHAVKVDKVIYKYIPDANTRMFALQNGEIDTIADVGGVLPEQVSILKKDNAIAIYNQEVATSHYLFFNTKKEPFNNIKLRQAVSMAINRQELIEQTLYGYGEPARSVITPLAQNWISSKVQPEYNLAEAKILVGQVLQGKTEKVTLLVHSGMTGRWPYKSVAEIIQSKLGELGLQVEIQLLEGGAWNKALKSGDYNMSLRPFTLATGDPHFFFDSWLASQGDLNVKHGIGYSNSEADALISSAVKEMNVNDRLAAYNQLQEITARDLPVTPLWHDETIYAAKKYVKGIKLNAIFKPNLEEISIDKK